MKNTIIWISGEFFLPLYIRILGVTHLCGDIMHEVMDGNDELLNAARTKPSSHSPLFNKKRSV
jgi:hypothetical protein